MAQLVTFETAKVPLQLQRGVCCNAALTATSACENELVFKVKTTNPDRFIVDPLAGVIHANEALSVSIRTDPIKELWPEIGEQCRDKFLMQVAIRPLLDEQEVVADVWEKIGEDQIQNVVFQCIPELVGDWFKLDISPGELAFDFKPGEELKQTLSVTNNDAMEIGFKMKTNKPQRYTVKPPNGSLQPGSNTTVEILCSPFEEMPAKDLFNDTFLAQMVKVDGRPAESVWQNCRKDEVISQTIDVKILNPEEASKSPASESDPDSEEVSPTSEEKPKLCGCQMQ